MQSIRNSHSPSPSNILLYQTNAFISIKITKFRQIQNNTNQITKGINLQGTLSQYCVQPQNLILNRFYQQQTPIKIPIRLMAINMRRSIVYRLDMNRNKIIKDACIGCLQYLQIPVLTSPFEYDLVYDNASIYWPVKMFFKEQGLKIQGPNLIVEIVIPISPMTVNAILMGRGVVKRMVDLCETGFRQQIIAMYAIDDAILQIYLQYKGQEGEHACNDTLNLINAITTCCTKNNEYNTALYKQCCYMCGLLSRDEAENRLGMGMQIQ